MKTSKIEKKRRIRKIRVPVPKPTSPHRDGKKYDRRRLPRPGEEGREA